MSLCEVLFWQMPLIENPKSIYPEDGYGCGSGGSSYPKREPLPFEKCVKINLVDGRVAALWDQDDLEMAKKEIEQLYLEHERIIVIFPESTSYDYIKPSDILGIFQGLT